MIGALGDLVDDIAVYLDGPVRRGTDTPSTIRRRRGGSAANMAVSVVREGGVARFIGRVGDDAVGDVLVDELRAAGVEPVVQRGGHTGTIVVLVDRDGERSFLTDRGACADLVDPQPSWLDGLGVLHVPAYSLVGGSLARTAATLIGWSLQRGVRVSVDVSSSALVEQVGASEMLGLLARLAPDIVFANEAEATALGGADALSTVGARLTVVKQGPAPVLVRTGDAAEWQQVSAPPLSEVRDTTGAGDGFAAGFLLALQAGAGPIEAARAGHRAAATAIAAVSSLSP